MRLCRVLRRLHSQVIVIACLIVPVMMMLLLLRRRQMNGSCCGSQLVLQGNRFENKVVVHSTDMRGGRRRDWAIADVVAADPTEGVAIAWRLKQKESL